ncbi:MAG: helix-turn-helix transcriptional regulator [Defluviitaleaceae bacterium]|nr:helix-turn-helix transcriptional regulator [Defluviitaleaceae bacterium]
MNEQKPTIAQKLREIRKYKGFKQIKFAETLGCALSKISDIENGKKHYSAHQIAALKKLMGVEGAPLTDDELAAFKKRLHVWRNYIKESRIEEGRKVQDELSIIADLPFEKDLRIIYEIFRAKQAMEEKDITLARELLEAVENIAKGAGCEAQYHLRYTVGSLNAFEGRYNEALKSYLEALSLQVDGLENEPLLYYNLAICYSRLGRYVLSINTILRIYNEFDNGMTSVIGMHLDGALSANYIRLKQNEAALSVLEKALDRARNLGYKNNIAIALHNFGISYFQMGNPEKALTYFEQSITAFGESSDKLESIYCKIRCLAAMKKGSRYKPLLIQAKALSEGDEHYTLLFNSLSHLLNLKEERSIAYIENITIPYLIGKYDYFRVLYYCDALIAAHTKNEARVKALEVKSLRADIVDEITFGGNFR